MNTETIEKGKSAAITGYILLVGVLIAMSMNSEEKNPFASFHIRQAVGLSLLFISLGMVLSPFGSWFITGPMYLFVSVLWGYGISTAVKGEMRPIPLVGTFFQRIFKTF